MNIIRDYKSCPEIAKRSVVALGNFDGVHKGHVAVIQKTREIANLEGCSVSVLTFEPHPLTIIKPDIASFRLTLENQKIDIMKSLSVDNLFIINFTKEFSQLTADEFMNKVLVKGLDVAHIVTGEDFIFGYNRQGNADVLTKAASIHDFGYTRVMPVGSADEVFSSSVVRKNLESGKLDEVKSILGRNFTICGEVQEGDKKGRTIGFPTININIGEYLRPAFGVYAVKVLIKGELPLYGAANIGKRPTIGGEKELLEVHIFDFNENIYGSFVEVELISYIRPEKKFASLDELRLQIEADCEEIKRHCHSR